MQLKAIGHPMASPHDKAQVSDESITKPTSKVKSSSKASSLSHEKALKRETTNEITCVLRTINATVSISEGKSILFIEKRNSSWEFRRIFAIDSPKLVHNCSHLIWSKSLRSYEEGECFGSFPIRNFSEFSFRACRYV